MTFLESQISLAALIEASRAQTYDKWTLRVLPTGAYYGMNCVLNSFKVSGFTQKHRNAKLLTWQLMDILPSLKLLNAVTTLILSCWFPCFCYLQPKGIYLKEARSGLEPESPVHFRTWTWKAGDITQSLICYWTFFTFTYVSILNSGFGGLGAACWPLVPKFAVSNPAEAVGFLGRKILITPSFGGEVKPSVPCRRFAACKISLNLLGSRNLGKIIGQFLAHSYTFRC